MPKNKKASPFMVFALEYKTKNKLHNMPLQKVIEKAGDIWKTMPEQAKSKYKERVKKYDPIPIKCEKKSGEKKTADGVPLINIEDKRREAEISERVMKKEILDFVNNSKDNDDLENLKFFFIMGNYFVCNTDGDYHLPAEIAISKFSLKNGIINKFHSFINPGDALFGYAYEAVEHSQKTHKLPLYPNALGESDLGKLYIELLKFISIDDTDLSPSVVYTDKDSVPVIQSMLRYLHQDCIQDSVPEIHVYPMQYLFYTLKMATLEIGEIKQPCSIYLTDSILQNDIFEYTANLSCNFHEENDCTKYCALSCVVRWAYMFADNLCMDLALPMIPDQHCPINTDLNFMNKNTSVRNNSDDENDEKTYNIKNESVSYKNERRNSGFIKNESR